MLHMPNKDFVRSLTAAVLKRQGLPNNLFGGFDKLDSGLSKKIGQSVFAENFQDKKAFLEAIVISSLRNEVTLQIMKELMEIARLKEADGIEDENVLLEMTRSKILKLAVAARTDIPHVYGLHEGDDKILESQQVATDLSWIHFLLPSVDSAENLTKEEFLQFTKEFLQTLENIYTNNNGSHEAEAKKIKLSEFKLSLPKNFPVHLRQFFTNPESSFVSAKHLNDVMPKKITEFREHPANYFALNSARSNILYSANDLAKEFGISAKTNLSDHDIIEIATAISKGGIYLLDMERKNLFLQWTTNHIQIKHVVD